MSQNDEELTGAELLATLEDDEDSRELTLSAGAAINRSEVEAQLDAAHKYPRSIKRFLDEAIGMATITVDVAESCIYGLPRGDKIISGPSVRLAEIASSAYGNLHVGARVLDVEEKVVVGQGVAWDLQKNLRVSIESSRRILDKKGNRFNEDMINMTGNAAAAIAYRNAVFKVIPGAYIKQIYGAAKRVAVGDASTLEQKRATLFERFAKMGATPDRVLARVAKAGIADIGLEEIELLIGLGTAIKNGDKTVDEVFPPIPAGAKPPTPVAASASEELRKKGTRAAQKSTAEPTAPGPASQPQGGAPVNPAQSSVRAPGKVAEDGNDAAKSRQGGETPAKSSGDHAGPSNPGNAPSRAAEEPVEPRPSQGDPPPNWEKIGQALWDRIEQAATLDALTVIGDELTAAEKAGAPSTKAIRHKLHERMLALEPPDTDKPAVNWAKELDRMEGYVRLAYEKGSSQSDRDEVDKMCKSFMNGCPEAIAAKLAKFLREAKAGKLEPEIPFGRP